MSPDSVNLGRYERQMVFPPIGLATQRQLLGRRVLLAGVGGLGSWLAELLARCGIGTLRVVDDDKVQMSNLHRQAMYQEGDAQANRPKVHCAAAYLRQINSQVTVEPVEDRIDKDNIASLADGMDLILDGTDNFAARFLINDFCVKTRLPWIFGGVVGAQGQTMTIMPPRTPCLRCISDTPPPPCVDPSCRVAGVLGPAVAAIASIQAMEAMKILSGNIDAVSPYLIKIDLWDNQVQRIDVRQSAAAVDCPCCKKRQFDYLEA